MTTDPKMLSDAIVVLLVAAKGVIDWKGGKKRDTRHGEALDSRFATLDVSLERRFNTVSGEIAEVRAFVVGPDGENGIRGDVREIRARVIGLEDRERERDRDERQTYDRRRTS